VIFLSHFYKENYTPSGFIYEGT